MATDFFKTNTPKVVCVGQNYKAHCEEMGSPYPTKPLLFFKPTTCMTFEGTPVKLPMDQGTLNHEIELVACIGKPMKNVSKEEALNYVEGYTLGVDMTSRTMQANEKKMGWPWTLSKGQDNFLPIINKVISPSKIDLDDTEIWLEIDGEVKQKTNVNDMIFTLPTLLSYITKYITLNPGDLVMTGTPSGVGPVVAGNKMKFGMYSPKFTQNDTDDFTAEFYVEGTTTEDK